MARLPELVSLPAVLAIALSVLWGTTACGLLSDDYGIIERVHRKGPAQAALDDLRGSYLGMAERFHRPVAGALFAAEAAAFGPDPLPYHFVSLGLLLAAGVLLAAVGRALGLGPWTAAAGVLLFLLLPAHVECLGWTVAGQLELVALPFLAAALLGVLRRAWWTFPCALAAYGCKESAYGFAPFVVLLALLAPRGDGRRGDVALAAGHVVVAGAAFALRTLAVGGLQAPYALGPQAGLLPRALAQLDALPRAIVVSVGWPAAVLWAVALVAWAVHCWRRRAERPVAAAVRALLPLLAFLAFCGPLLALPLDAVRAEANARSFVPAALGATALLFVVLARVPARAAALVALLAAAVGSATLGTRLQEHFLALSRSCAQGVAAVAELPGERLLLARPPAGMQWAYPAAAKPPFRDEPRTVYPLREGTDNARDVVALRPLGGSVSVVDMTADPPRVVPEAPAAAESGVQLERAGAASLRLAGTPLPLRALPSLVVTPLPDGRGGRVALSIETDAGRTLDYELPFVAAPPLPSVVVLTDVPTWPTATVRSLVVHEALDAVPGPPFPGRLQITDPTPGSTLSPRDAARAFRIEGLPPGTAALKVTLLTAGGAALPEVVPGRTFTFAELVGRPWFWYVLDFASRLGSDTYYLKVEALADAANPQSILARAPLARYTIHVRE